LFSGKKIRRLEKEAVAEDSATVHANVAEDGISIRLNSIPVDSIPVNGIPVNSIPVDSVPVKTAAAPSLVEKEPSLIEKEEKERKLKSIVIK
jgi:hypothetical protein